MAEPIPPTIDVYPVGVLADLLRLRNALHRRHPKAIRWALGRLRSQARYITRQARRGNWRAVRNAFNGYLAEHRTLGTRCGKGWTRRRALLDLYRHLVQEG